MISTRNPRLLIPATLLLLTGCALAPTAPRADGLSGALHGGQQPISGVTVQLYAVGTTGDGSPSTPLLTHSVLSDANGNFHLTGAYTCPSASTLVYLVGTGGNPGLGAGQSNPQIALMAALGPCGNLSSSTFIQVNEVTTVAAAYALAPYALSPSAIGSGSSDAAAIANAFTLAAEFASIGTGNSPGTGIPANLAAPVAQINTIANILAACINSHGGISGDGSPCGSFLALTTPSGTTPPTDALTALLHLALNPTLNTQPLYNLAPPTGPFQPNDTILPADLSVALVQATFMQLTPTAGLSFPATPVGYVNTLTATLTISGPSSVIGSSIAITGTNASDFAQTSNCSGTIAANTSCTITVVFTPTAPTSRSATLTVGSVAKNSPLSLPLTGTGTGPQISVSPNQLNFTSVVNTPAAPQNFTLTDLGPGTLTFAGFQLAGANPGDFTQTNNCPSTLANGAFCTFTVNATPSALGGHNALLYINSNASTATYPVGLFVNGTAPVNNGPLVASTPSLFVAAGSTGLVDLTNQGSAAVNISSITPSGFFTQTNNCGSSLAAGATCVVTVASSDFASQIDTGTLTIANSSASPQIVISLLTSGLQVQNFNSSVVGQPGTSIPFFGVNTSGNNYSANGSVSGPNVSDFAFNPPSCTSRGSNCSINAQFTPSAPGARAVVLNVNGNLYAGIGFGFPAGAAQTVTANPTSLTFAQTAVNQSTTAQTITLTNPQAHLLNLTSQTADYLVSPAFCSTASCTVSVVFKPLTLGATNNNGSLKVLDSVTNQTFSFPLNGVGGIPTLTFNPGQLDFGSLAVGATSAGQHFTLTVTGDTPGYITASIPIGPTAPGLNSSDFTPIGGNSGIYLAGYTYGFGTISFTPTGLGNRNANISFTDSRSGLLLATYAFTGTGTGSPNASLTASTSSLNFPNTVINTSAPTQTFTITNVGNISATLGAISFSGFAPTDFTQTNNCPASLSYSASCTFQVTFTPTAINYRSANLLIPSNDPNSPLTIPVSGYALRVPLVTLSPASLTFYEGTAQPITLTNNTGAPLSISAINMVTNSSATQEFAQTNNCGSTVATGASCTINVTAGPDHANFTGTLTVVDNDTTDPQVVNLSGFLLYSTVVDFGQVANVYNATSVPHSFTHYGGGSFSLNEGGPTPEDFPGYNGGGFSCFGYNGNSCTVNVVFRPTGNGGAPPTASGVRYSTVDTSDGSHYLFKGTAVDPTYNFTVQSSLNMGTINVGSSTTQVLTLNDSSTPFPAAESSASAVLSTGPSNTGDFSINPATCYFSNNSCSFSVKFTPQATGPRSSTLTLTDTHGVSKTISITGTGN